MIAKELENLLASETDRSASEMVQRFQKLRDFGVLPRSRGRNAEDLSVREIAGGLLSLVDERPSYAGLTAKVLMGLVPTNDDSFFESSSFGAALAKILTDDDIRERVLEVCASPSEIGKNASGLGVIVYADGKKERTAYFVHRTAVSVTVGNMKFNPRASISAVIVQTVFFRRLFDKIVRRVRDIEKHQARTRSVDTRK